MPRREHFDAGHGMPHHSSAHQADMDRAQASNNAADAEIAYWQDFEKKLRKPSLREPGNSDVVDNPDDSWDPADYGFYHHADDWDDMVDTLPMNSHGGARKVAGGMSRGPNSAMFEFSTSGRIRPDLIDEIQGHINTARTGQDKNELNKVLNVVKDRVRWGDVGETGGD